MVLGGNGPGFDVSLLVLPLVSAVASLGIPPRPGHLCVGRISRCCGGRAAPWAPVARVHRAGRDPTSPSPLSPSSSLCGQGNGPLGDYLFNDGLGHDYSANICGAASKKCLPKGWVQTYEYGVAIQSWGSVPPCNASDPTTMTCKEKNGMIPSCCTEDCQVLGVGSPQLKLANPLNIQGGLNATFSGAPPDDDDPFWCPWNPQTGSQFPRTVTFQLECDTLVSGAIPILAVQNKTEDCE